MAEPVVVDPPVVDPPPTDPSVPVLFGEDGNFSENWTHTLKNETLHDDPTLKTIRNMDSLASVLVNTKSMVGKNTMEIPTDVSSEDVWNEYHKIGGKPETVADYNLKAPDDFPKDILETVFPKVKLEAWQERFFKAGISKKAADQFIAAFATDMLTDLKVATMAAEQEESEFVSNLTRDWGGAYDQKIHLGNMAIEEGTDHNAEFKARVVAKVQKDPDLTRLLANLGSKFAEGKPPNFGNIPTPADYQTQIDEIRANPLYQGGTLEQRMKLANQELLIRKQMNPEKAV